MKIARLVINILLTALMGYIAYEVHGTLKLAEMKEYWENKDFKTDTTVIEVDYSKLPTPRFDRVVPPALVVNYIDSTSKVEINHLVVNDSLLVVIDSLKEEIARITRDFLINFPTSPKLIYGEFNIDSIRLDLYDINGIYNSHRYHVNLHRFNYSWADGEITAKKYPRYSKALSWDFTAYLGVSIFEIKPLLGGEVGLNTGRFRFTSDTHLTPSKDTDFRSYLTAGYRIR